MSKNIRRKSNMLFLISACVFSPLSGSESPNIGDLIVFPEDNPWNWDISAHQVHPNSENFIESIGTDEPLHPDFGTIWNGAPNGIPYTVVTGDQEEVSVIYTAYGPESDPGPFPIPLDAPIEGGPDGSGDRHVITIDIDNQMLYELYSAFPVEGHWEARSGAKFDLSSNVLRPEGWTSADAAGLPILPGLVRYKDVYIKIQINHALRFTVQNTQKKYIWPARHFASSSVNPNYPPMGLRFRLKSDFDISQFSEPIQVILLALKTYGMIVADNGSNWFISGAPDDRWNDDVLAELKTVTGSNFEAIQTVDANGDPIYPNPTSINTKKLTKINFSISHHPNPFNSSSTIKYRLPQAGHATLKIVNLLGQEIITLFDGYQSAGDHELRWHPTGLASGIYFYRFQANESILVGKIILQK